MRIKAVRNCIYIMSIQTNLSLAEEILCSFEIDQSHSSA